MSVESEIYYVFLQITEKETHQFQENEKALG
jgi:hypothetical protein